MVAVSDTKSCRHPEGFRLFVDSDVGTKYRCPVCEARLDLDGVARWVREAEEARDSAETSALHRREELQEEVYRRRKAFYGAQEAPRQTSARPEMMLVLHEASSECYECRIFYKEPRPEMEPELLTIPADQDSILRLRAHRDPGVRLAALKVGEFHDLRLSSGSDPYPPRRRVFYANEL